MIPLCNPNTGTWKTLTLASEEREKLKRHSQATAASAPPTLPPNLKKRGPTLGPFGAESLFQPHREHSESLSCVRLYSRIPDEAHSLYLILALREAGTWSNHLKMRKPERGGGYKVGSPPLCCTPPPPGSAICIVSTGAPPPAPELGGTTGTAQKSRNPVLFLSVSPACTILTSHLHTPQDLRPRPHESRMSKFFHRSRTPLAL